MRQQHQVVTLCFFIDYLSNIIFSPIVIGVAQLFCTLPIYGVFNKDHTKVRFKWISARTIANLTFMLFTLFEIFLSFKLIHQMGMDFRNGELLSFCIFCLVEATLFFLLSRKWSEIISFWYKKERVFLNYPYEIDGWSLKKKIKFGAFTILFFALREYLTIFQKCKTVY